MTMKKKLYKAFESSTPDVMNRVLQACPTVEKKGSGGSLVYRTDRLWQRSALSTAAAVVVFLSVCGVAVWMISSGAHLGVVDPSIFTEPSHQVTQPSEITLPTQTDPPQTTEPIQTETDPPMTEPLPTDSTEINKYSWYVENPPSMSYEEFFSRPRVLANPLNNTWTAPTGTVYQLRATDEGLQVCQYRGGAFYTVPGFEGPDCGVTPAFCNGNIAYVYSDTQLLRLDVMTGETAVIVEYDRFLDKSDRGPYLMYFVAATGDKAAIYQIYIPTETVELLCSETSSQTLPGWFRFGGQKTTEDPMTWEIVNPKAYAILEQEVRKPDSVLLEDADVAKSFIELWANPEKLDEELQYDGSANHLLMVLQDKFDVNALVRCSYDLATGTYTEKEGIVDSCAFGSDMCHDHFAPEKTESILPKVIDTRMTPAEGLTPPPKEIADKMREETWGADQQKYTAHAELYDFYYLCVKENGDYRRVCEVPMLKIYEVVHTANGSYFITMDGRILWVDNDENVTQIYQAQFGELEYIAYRKGKLCVVDGDHIVMLDLVECTSCALLQHPGRICMYFDSDNELYVDIVLGLDVSAYIFNFETGTLEQTGPRL